MNHDDESGTPQPPDHLESIHRSDSDDGSLTSSTCSFESLNYYPEERTYRALFDTDDISPSEAVVGAISAVANVDPLDVEQLGSKVDADALDTVLDPGKTLAGDVHVTFTLHGCDVRLSSYGGLELRPLRSDEPTENPESK